MPKVKKPDQFEVQIDDAFSSNMQKDDMEDEEDAENRRDSYLTYDTAPVQPISPFNRTAQYAPLSSQNDLGGAHPQLAGLGVRYSHPTVVDHDTSYGGAYSDRRIS